MSLKWCSILVGSGIAIWLLGMQATAQSEEHFPGAEGLKVTSGCSEAESVWKIEEVMQANGFRLDARSMAAEHQYQFEFRWTRPGTERDFWSPVNKWQGEGTLDARLVPGGSDGATQWSITLQAKTFAAEVTRADMEKAILELLSEKLPPALTSKERK